ncbi:11295_t:CDS:2 [Funneliformis caledonium]|uniref:11295_t:CDS:1 n=1 Tax=Funneliformis caledonium TaxID=1117310 RepID=A0A9N8VSC4_9GLOM|nr:11295_t:CDS:2 [Funneliformis caledonium]
MDNYMKSTNRIDDVLVLTSKGNELFTNINLRIDKDRQCWYWVIYCSGDENTCQRLCNDVESCLESYSIVISRRADHRNVKGIKAKILAPLNDASEDTISKSLTNQHLICDNSKLQQFIKKDDKSLKTI